jgi:hypothetical protein
MLAATDGERALSGSFVSNAVALTPQHGEI